MRRPQRYGWAASAYDVISLEWPVYRVGRVAGVDALALQPGDRVIDIGCGTGLSLPLLRRAVGPAGRVVGLDASPTMLRQASRRVQRGGWDNVDLVRGDATEMTTDALRGRCVGSDETRVDALIFIYSLSLMKPWQGAWGRALASAGPGARFAVVDLAEPTGAARSWAPLARLACRIGGADITAHPWTAVERDLTNVTSVSLRGGHIQVRAGNLP